MNMKIYNNMIKKMFNYNQHNKTKFRVKKKFNMKIKINYKNNKKYNKIMIK